MVPGGPQQVEDGGLHCQGAREAMDQFPGVLTDNLGPEDPPSLGLGQHFHIAVVCLHQDRLPVIIEGIGCGDVVDPRLLQVRLQAANGRQLRVGENHVEEERVVNGLEPCHTEGMARRELGLLNRDVHDLVGPAAVPCRVDVRDARLLPAIGDDLPVGPRRHAGCRKVEPRGVGLPTQRVEEVRCLPDHGLAIVDKGHADAVSGAGDRLYLGPRE